MARPVGNTTGEIQLLYNPYQVAFLHALDQQTAAGKWAFSRLTLFAGRRGGKTKIGGVACQKLSKRPGTIGWVCAPTYPDLHDFVMPSVFASMPEAWIKDWSAQYLTLYLKNDSIISFRSLDDPERARGPGLDWAWIDESRKVSERAWDTMLPALSDKSGQAFFTSSTNGFDWCYKRLYKPALEGVPGFWACRYKTSENPAVPKDEIERARRELDPLFFAQEYEADFVTFAGAIYGPAIDPCILRGEAITRVLPEWPRIDPTRPCLVAMDPGADHPFAMVLLVLTERGLVVCGEYLERNKPVVQHVRGYRQMLAQRSAAFPLEPTRIGIDRSQKQWIIELAQHGVYTSPAENNVVAGIQRVHSWMASNQFFLIEAAVPRTIEQLRNYKWAENTKPDGQLAREQVVKLDDDLCDALRYALMLWPELPEHSTRLDQLRALDSVDPSLRWQVDRMRRLARAERGEHDEDEDALVTAASDGDAEADSDSLAGASSNEHPLGDFWG